MVVTITWIIVIILFILSYVGIVFPLIPSALVLWIGFFLYQFVIDSDQLTVFFWIAMAIFTILLIGADLIANSYFVKKFGGSKWGERGAVIAVIIGSFIMPPFGILIIPFITVFIIEMIQRKTLIDSMYASIGSLLAFLSGAVAKIIIQTMMIIWFIITVII